MRSVLLISILSVSTAGFAQLATGIGYKGAMINASVLDYQSRLTVWNSNETTDTYAVNNTIGAAAQTLSLRSYGKKYFYDQKFKAAYSLEIGLQYFSSRGQFLYESSSTTYADSIINAYNGFAYRTDYTTVYFNHFADFYFPLKDDLRLVISAGLGINALMRAKSKEIPRASIIDTDFPVMATSTLEIQLLEKYKKHDVGYFISLNIYNLALYSWKDEDLEYGDERLKFSSLRFNGIGLRWIPHPKQKPTVPVVE